MARTPGPNEVAGVIDIEMVGDTQDVEAMIDHLMTRLSFHELEFFLGHEIEPFLKDRIERRFQSEGDDVSGAWAPLSATTQAIRAAGNPQWWTVGPDSPINQRTLAMYDYLTRGTWQTRAAGGLGIALISPTDQQNNRKMRAKLRGAAFGEGTAPPRPVLGLGEADLRYFLIKFAYHLQGP